MSRANPVRTRSLRQKNESITVAASVPCGTGIVPGMTGAGKAASRQQWPPAPAGRKLSSPTVLERRHFPTMTAPTYDKLKAPTTGTRAVIQNGTWKFPDDPVVCLIRGDGIGADVNSVPGITASAVKVLDAAVKKAYGGKRTIAWFDVHAGDAAR